MQRIMVATMAMVALMGAPQTGLAQSQGGTGTESTANGTPAPGSPGGPVGNAMGGSVGNAPGGVGVPGSPNFGEAPPPSAPAKPGVAGTK